MEGRGAKSPVLDCTLSSPERATFQMVKCRPFRARTVGRTRPGVCTPGYQIRPFRAMRVVDSSHEIRREISVGTCYPCIQRFRRQIAFHGHACGIYFYMISGAKHAEQSIAWVSGVPPLVRIFQGSNGVTYILHELRRQISVGICLPCFGSVPLRYGPEGVECGSLGCKPQVLDYALSSPQRATFQMVQCHLVKPLSPLRFSFRLHQRPSDLRRRKHRIR